MSVSKLADYVCQLIHVSNLFCVWLVIVVAVQVSTIEVSAQTTLTVDPAFQEVVISADQNEVATEIAFTNTYGESIELEILAYDFTQTDILGSVGIIPPDQSYPHTLASFLEFEQNKLVLAAGETRRLKIRVRNRVSLTPGGHYAAVIARVAQLHTGTENQRVIPAVSALILVRKTGGEQHHLSLSDSSWQPKAVVFSLPNKIELLFRNDGNVHDIPRGKIIATSIRGTIVSEGIINQSSFYVLPGTQRRIPVLLEPRHWQLPIDVVTLTTAGRAQYSDIPYSQEESFVLVQWQFLAALACLTSLGGSVWFWKRKRHR